jgi:hypothetical protein
MHNGCCPSFTLEESGYPAVVWLGARVARGDSYTVGIEE